MDRDGGLLANAALTLGLQRGSAHCGICTAPSDKSGPLYILSHNSAVRATQKLYRTILELRESRNSGTVSFADRVSHPVDPPRRFLHVLRAGGSARNGQSPEQSIPVMHATGIRIQSHNPEVPMLDHLRISENSGESECGPDL